jgi:membrane protein implicated in regulation of membrane protease activity
MPDRRDISEAERRRVRQIRRAAIVMAATMVLWIAAQYIGGQMGWQPRFAFLIDLAAFAALVWALIVTYWVWKERKRDPDHR